MGDKPAGEWAVVNAALQQVLAERDAYAQQVWESKRFAGELAIARQHLADELARVRDVERAAADEAAAQAIAAARAERDAAVAERDAAWAARDRAVRDRDVALVARDDATALLARVRASTSWRLTAPLRRAMALARGRTVE